MSRYVVEHNLLLFLGESLVKCEHNVSSIGIVTCLGHKMLNCLMGTVELEWLGKFKKKAFARYVHFKS